MARPYRGDRVQVTTKLPVTAFEKLERYVNATGQKKQDFTSAVILAALERIDIDKIEGQEQLPMSA